MKDSTSAEWPHRLTEHFAGKRLEAAQQLLADCPAPRLATVRLSRILDSIASSDWIDTALFDGDVPRPLLSILISVVSQSEFLASIVEREPGLLVSFKSEREFDFSSGKEIFAKELHRHLADLRPDEPFQLGLCRFKLHELFRIAVRDITRRNTIEVLARELSDLADVILQAAYEKVYADTLLSQGAPRFHTGDLAELAILSLGKHGSRELNFSSDLDLILLHPAEGFTELGSREEAHRQWLQQHPYAEYQISVKVPYRSRPVEFEKFFTEVGTRLIEMLSDPSPLGVVYRIDMRLRPEGASGPLVRTVDSALQYYHNWGERWERQALIRARLSAGNIALAHVFLSGIEDFVFRKYVDDVEVEETLRAMRRLRYRSIGLAGTDPESRKRNVKNGAGGIRDVEFLVQAVQTLYGGQYPELRLGNLFELLRRIHQSGLMGVQEFETLSKGYEFLRRVEHRVQMDDLQKYHLPTDPEKLEVTARGLGFETGKALEDHLFSQMVQVHEVFDVVFRAEEEDESIGLILDTAELTDRFREALLNHGITDPNAFHRSIKRLTVDPDSPHLNSKLHRLLKAILPRLLASIRDTPSPEQAWRTFETISLATPARSTFFSVAQDNPLFVKLLVTLGSASPYLANQFASYPNLVDEMVRRASFDAVQNPQEFAELFDSQEGSVDEVETFLSRIRAFRIRSDVHLAGRYVMGLSTIAEAVHELTALAEFCLARCAHQVWGEEGRGMLILALGKFGGREIGFGSDLDLILVYDPAFYSDSEVPQRLASQLSVVMNAREPKGRLFPMDLRLRPHGKSAPLVPSIESALEYYRKEGQTWERLAMTRCRPVWGNPEALQRLENGLTEWLFDLPHATDLLKEVSDMRSRIEREKSSETLKAGPGGLLDIEFLSQAGQLLRGGSSPDIRSTETLAGIQGLGKLGVLSHEESRTLEESYLFLRDLENRLCLLGKVGGKGLPRLEEDLVHLVGCLNTAQGGDTGEVWTHKNLIEQDLRTRSRVREIYEAVFARGLAEIRE